MVIHGINWNGFNLNGVVFVIIFAIAFATLVLDLIYPFIDPRITYERA